MNIKSLRKGYENLTMLERLSLVDNAESRGDDNEMLAIGAASPRESFSVPDFYLLLDKILHFRLCSLIIRLGYVMNFDHFLRVGLHKLKNLSKSDNPDTIFDDAKLAAYLYVRETDSWKIINDELGLRPDFDGDFGDLLISVQLLKNKEELMRKMAFTEDEAKVYVLDETGERKLRTIEDEAQAIREILCLPKR